MPAPRVLLVDDHDGWVAIATEALRARGAVVAHAPSADRGVVLARTHAPDAVFVGLDLEGGAAALLDRAASRGARLVGLVGVADAAAEERARRLGLDGVVARSLDPAALMEAVSPS